MKAKNWIARVALAGAALVTAAAGQAAELVVGQVAPTTGLEAIFGDNYNLGGYVVGFKPGMRSGSRFVELSIISGAGKIRQ